MNFDKVTLISHFYNEEYLLPWWLHYHKKIFKNAIIIDYKSTDNSTYLINKICPDWKIVQSKNELFNAVLVDREVEFYEKEIKGYKICLNTTEFIYGNFYEELSFDGSQHCYELQSYAIIDHNPSEVLNYEDDLVNKKNFGHRDGSRYIHNYPIGQYTAGRHQTQLLVEKTLKSNIRWFKYAPWTKDFIKRKMQIKNRIPIADLNNGMGGHHIWSLEEMKSDMENRRRSCIFI